MTRLKYYRRLHLAMVIWFFLCAAYLLVFGFRRAGMNWWTIFTLSGHSVLLLGIMMAIYLYAIFHGIGKANQIQLEHPLTSSEYYLFLYTHMPLIGITAGLTACFGAQGILHVLTTLSLATVLSTFLMWVILDPAISALEPIAVPSARQCKKTRLAAQRQQKHQKEKKRQQLFEEVLATEQQQRQQLRKLIEADADSLASLLSSTEDGETIRKKVVELGLTAWQKGGLQCMRELRELAISKCRSELKSNSGIDYLSFWWDGVGGWKAPAMDDIKPR